MSENRIELKCEMCAVNDHKYKCPKCASNYCSVACYRTHTLKCSQVDADVQNPKRSREVCSNHGVEVTKPEHAVHTDHDCAEDRVPPEKLELLGRDAQLLECLKNPHLRVIVRALNATSEPNADVLAAMKEPIFAEFVDHCLRIVESDTRNDT